MATLTTRRVEYAMPIHVALEVEVGKHASLHDWLVDRAWEKGYDEFPEGWDEGEFESGVELSNRPDGLNLVGYVEIPA